MFITTCTEKFLHNEIKIEIPVFSVLYFRVDGLAMPTSLDHCANLAS